MPRRLRAYGGSEPIFSSLNSRYPLDALNRPDIMLKSVVLPAPFGPMIA